MKIYNEKWSKRKWLEDPLNFVKYPEKAQRKGGDGVKGHPFSWCEFVVYKDGAGAWPEPHTPTGPLDF